MMELRGRTERGSIHVLENRSSSSGRQILLPYVVYRLHSVRASEPVFLLNGGPGVGNLGLRPDAGLLANHDVVLMGYRGVEGSVRLSCPEVGRTLRDQRRPLCEAGVAAMHNSLTRAFDRLASNDIDLAGYSVAEMALDIEDLRVALGYERLSLLALSFGTRVALLYANMRPERVVRCVLIGANPPGGFTWDAKIVEQRISEYSSRYGAAHGEKEDALQERMENVMRNMPSRWGPFHIDPDKVRMCAFVMLFHRATSCLLFETVCRAAGGDASGLAMLSQTFDHVLSRMFVWGDFVLKACTADFDCGQDYARMLNPEGMSVGAPIASYFFASMPTRHLHCVAGSHRSLAPIDVPTLVLSGNLDPSTPPEAVERKLMPLLRKGKHLVFSDYGHVADLLSIPGGEPMRRSIEFLAGCDLREVGTPPVTGVEFARSFGLGGIMKSFVFGPPLLLLATALACGAASR